MTTENQLNCTSLVRRERNYVVLIISTNGEGYPIEYKRMNTPEKLIGWIYHLTKKGNVTREHLKSLIEVAKDIGVEIDFHA